MAVLLGAGSAVSYVVFNYNNSISLKELNTELNQSSLIYDSEGVLLDEVHGEEHRKIVPLKNIDEDIIRAVVGIEDKLFFEHNGVSKRGIARAMYKNYKTKSKSEGASTITMQLTKNLIDTVGERTWDNKIRETFLALKLEKELTKYEILELYLNTIYWGNNTYGIEAATETYFGKSASDVSYAEASALAAMIQNPSRYNVYQSNRDTAYSALKNRQRDVLNAMASHYTGCSKEEPQCLSEWVDKQHSEPLLFSGKTTWQVSIEGYTTDMAMEEAVDILGLDSIEDLKVSGHRIYSTINKKHQDLAKTTINNYKGYKGGAEFGLAAIDPKTNKVIVSVGGTDYNKSPLNRTLKTAGLRGRQPGSSQKLYVYYRAMKFWDPTDLVIDEEYCVDMKWGKDYCPKNYDGSFKGPISLTQALSSSRNIPAVRLGQSVGLNSVVSTMKDLGISTKLEAVPSFPLGSNDLVVMEHVNAIAAFANEGKQQNYSSIQKIENSEGKIVYQYKDRQRQKLNRNQVDKLNVMTRATAVSGTSTAANTIANVHAKTGTTDNNKDVWCLGYVPGQISTGLWIGHDDFNKRLYGATGGGWACPVLGNFLKGMENNNYLN